MGRYALLDGDGNVINVIEAEQDFIDQLPQFIADPNVETGLLPVGVQIVDVDAIVDSEDVVPVPEPGGRRGDNGIFVRPGVQGDNGLVDQTDDDEGNPQPERVVTPPPAARRPEPADDRTPPTPPTPPRKAAPRTRGE